MSGKTDQERRIEKIALLLRKAESGACSPAESEAFTEMAEKLMIQHGIDEMMIQARKLGGDKAPDKIVQRRIPFTGVYARSYCMMGSSVATALNEIKTFFQKSGLNHKGETLILIGFESDVDQAVTLISSLQMQLAVAMNAMIKQDPIWQFKSPSEKYNDRRSFIQGFGDGAARRITNNKYRIVEEIKETTPGYALAVVDKKTSVAAYVEEMHRGVKVKNVKQNRVTSAYSDGHVAGRNANTGDKGIGTQGRIGS